MKARRAAVIVLLLAPALATAAEDSWAGKIIILKESGIKIGYTDPRDGETQRYVATLTLLSYRVIADNGEFVRVWEHGISGWFPRHRAVPADRAVAYFTAAINRQPRDAGLYQRRACAWHLQGNHDEAIKDIGVALRLRPKDHNLHNSRGLSYLAKGSYERAIEDFSAALRLEPANAIALSNRGTAHEGRHEPRKAIADFTRAIEIAPHYALAYSNRGSVYKQIKDYERARADFDEALRLDPRNLSAYLSRGGIHVQEEHYDRAARDYQQVIRLAPNDPRGYNALAWLRATCPQADYRDGKEALALAKEACARTGWKNPDYLDTLAAAQAENGRFQDAVKWLEIALLDPAYEAENGKLARERIRLYEQHRVYRDPAPTEDLAHRSMPNP